MFMKENPDKKEKKIVSNIKPFINEYKWKGMNYPSKLDDWKTFEKNNPAIPLNILYIKEKEVCPELNQCIMSDKMPYIIYADIESLIKKVDGCTNNPKNFSTTKIGEHIPCG